MFSTLLLVPCFCSTAFAQEADESDGGCCPEQAAQNSEPEEEPEEGCCCTGLSTCGESDEVAFHADGGALISTYEDEHSVDGPTTWWTPDLVATLWLVDQLSTFSDASFASEEIPSKQLRPDRSETYLTHLALLL